MQGFQHNTDARADPEGRRRGRGKQFQAVRVRGPRNAIEAEPNTANLLKNCSLLLPHTHHRINDDKNTHKHRRKPRYFM